MLCCEATSPGPAFSSRQSASFRMPFLAPSVFPHPLRLHIVLKALHDKPYNPTSGWDTPLHILIPTGLSLLQARKQDPNGKGKGVSVNLCVLPRFPPQLRIVQTTKTDEELTRPNVKLSTLSIKTVSKSHFFPSNTCLHNKGLEEGNPNLTWHCSLYRLCNQPHWIQKRQ